MLDGDAFLRFGPVGSLLLAVIPAGIFARYIISLPLSKWTDDLRPLESDERARLRQAYEEARLVVADTLLETVTEKRLAGLGGIPRARIFVLSKAAVESATDEELQGLTGIAAGHHEVRLPEVYSLILIASGTAFAALLGVDPSAFDSTLIAVLFAVVLLSISFVGFAVTRRRMYAADRAARERVGRAPVQAAISFVDTRQLPDRVPTAVRPKPSADKRRERLDP